MDTETQFPVKKLLRFTEDQVRRISIYWHGNHIQSESEAIRRLIDLGLEAAGSDGKPQTYDVGPASAPKKNK